MALLTDYLAQESLQRLQDEFVSVLRMPIRICSVDGEPLTRPTEPRPQRADEAQTDLDEPCAKVHHADVPIELEGEAIGRLVVGPRDDVPAGTPTSPRATRLLQLMANVIARRWNRQKILRTRIAELATMYRLTAEFSGRRDLQTVLNLVARTVRDLLKAKACAIRLLSNDQTELVVKAVSNLSDEYLRKGPILISESKIDREVVLEGKTVYIADMADDPRVLYPAEAQREGIVSGICAPMNYRGRCVGVLRVYMGGQHDFDWYERSMLQAVAAQAAAAIENARLDEEAERGAELKRSLSMAAEVQRRMFPAEAPKAPGLDIHATYIASLALGGDFYDFHEFAGGNLGVAVCDVVGKGVPASLLMASIRASLRAHAANIYELSEVISRVNRDLCADTAISDFATLFYGVIDTRQRRFTYANCGHTPPLLVRDGKCCHLTTGGGVLGIEPTFTWRHDSMILRPGDLLLIFTDGLNEAMNFQDEVFGMARVEAAAVEAARPDQTAAGVCRHVLWRMRRFTGLQTRLDDLTLVAIRVL